ncbi:MAG: SufD family Fe-S cluster assembly protein [Spirochaetaceae bacterium]|nr:SufD family Fe-S cluster assembly protein [Spirochaetaceae bacterium]
MTVAEQARSWIAELIERAGRFDAEHGGPPWLRALRRTGRERLAAGGLPLARDEAWTYTNVRPLLAQRFQDADGHAGETAETGWQPLALVDRPPVTAVSDFPQNAFTAMNQAFARSGFNVTVHAGESRFIEIVHRRHLRDDGGALYADAVRVELAPGARATVVERWEPADRSADAPHVAAATLHVPGSELVIAPGAALRYYRLADDDPKAFGFGSLRAAVGADAELDLALIGGGMAIDRTEVTVALLAGGARARLGGAAVLSGPAHGAIHTCVQHRAPECSSDQLFKTVLLDGARSAFQGTIEVDRVAQGTDAFQLSNTLLLHPDSRADARPQLRIGADQVRCTHGATSGPLAPEQLHYLQCRGLPRSTATAILVRGFLDEVNRRIEVPGVEAALQAQLDRGLATLEAA